MWKYQWCKRGFPKNILESEIQLHCIYLILRKSHPKCMEMMILFILHTEPYHLVPQSLIYGSYVRELVLKLSGLMKVMKEKRGWTKTNVWLITVLVNIWYKKKKTVQQHSSKWYLPNILPLKNIKSVENYSSITEKKQKESNLKLVDH